MQHELSKSAFLPTQWARYPKDERPRFSNVVRKVAPSCRPLIAAASGLDERPRHMDNILKVVWSSLS